MGDLVIPERLREVSVQWEGDRARTWLTELPGIVGTMTDEWELDVGPPFDPGGQISWVAPCTRRGDTTPLVLKVQLPHPESDGEAAALAAWQAEGAVRLHAHDAARAALLLERCEPGTVLRDEPDTEAAFAAGLGIAAGLHVEVPPGVRALAHIAEDWAALLDERGRLDGLDPGHWRLVVDAVRQQADPSAPVVLVHGDLNPWNVLAAERGWLAIDPKPLAGDPAWDVARLVLQLRVPADAEPTEVIGRRIAIAAEVLGVEPTAIALGCLVDAVNLASFLLARGNRAASEEQLGWAGRVVPSLG